MAKRDGSKQTNKQTKKETLLRLAENIYIPWIFKI